MRVWFLCGLVALLAVSCLSAQAYRLQFKDAQGARRVYKTRVGITGNFNMGSISAPVESTMTMTAQEQVSAVTNGKASVSYAVKNGSASIKVPSLGGEDGAPQTIEQSIPDFSMDFLRTPTGKISNLKVSGEASSLLGGPPNEVNNLLINPEEGLEFPDKDLQPGDTWSRTTTVALNADSKLVVVANYTLVGTKVAENGKTYLQVDVDLAMSLPKLAVTAGQGDQALNADMGLALKGKETVLFDEQAGELVQSACKMTGSVAMAAPGLADMPMQMTLSADILVKKS